MWKTLDDMEMYEVLLLLLLLLLLLPEVTTAILTCFRARLWMGSGTAKAGTPAGV
jgi:hypothetical protein